MSDAIQNHINNRDNPHGLTKEDLGLGNVQNFPIATDQECLSGTPGERLLTPAKLKLVFKGELMRKGYMNEEGNVILP